MTVYPFSASLVIGGTGMLAQATRWLAGRSETTLVVCRHASAFAADDPKLVPLDLDWQSATFERDLKAGLAHMPPIGNALLWLHDHEPVLPWLAPLLDSARTVLVLGSLDGNPALPHSAASITTVRLGSKVTPTGMRRWLTHEEISEGAILALSDGVCRVLGDLAEI